MKQLQKLLLLLAVTMSMFGVDEVHAQGYLPSLTDSGSIQRYGEGPRSLNLNFLGNHALDGNNLGAEGIGLLQPKQFPAVKTGQQIMDAFELRQDGSIASRPSCGLVTNLLKIIIEKALRGRCRF